MRVLAEIPAEATPSGTLRREGLEAFAGLLAGLGDSRTVLVTGSRARKRAIAVGMATAAAAAGTRAALIECDLGDPALAEALGVAAAPGLREYLRGEAEAGEILEPAVLAGPGSAAASEPLVCVVAGRPEDDGRALLESERFRDAIARLRRVYELLVLEGPSLDAEGGALAAVAAEADATLACVGRDDPPPSSPVPLTGLIVQG